MSSRHLCGTNNDSNDSNGSMARAALIACAAWLIIVLPLVAAGGVRVDPKTQQLLDVHGRVRVFHGVNAGACGPNMLRAAAA